jgi:hypothetical protein
MHQRQVAPCPEDDWSSVTSRKERKRRQNRLNQRARRQRNEKQNAESHGGQRIPYQVQRWRMTRATSTSPLRETMSTEIVPAKSDSPELGELVHYKAKFPGYLEMAHEIASCPILPPLSEPIYHSTSSSIGYSLSSDHLLIHLIHYNVFRGLTSNKAILASRSSIKKPTDLGELFLWENYCFCHYSLGPKTCLSPLQDSIHRSETCLWSGLFL